MLRTKSIQTDLHLNIYKTTAYIFSVCSAVLNFPPLFLVIIITNSDMDYIVEHFKQNAELYKTTISQLAKAIVGIAMVGITVACLHLVLFLAKILRLPKTSRQYSHKSEHVEGDALVRYGIMITCVFVMDGLIVTYFESGPRLMLIGLVGWTLFFLGRYVYNLAIEKRVKQERLKQQ